MPLLETWQEIGPHRVRTEEDVIFLQVVGNLSLEETRAICALSEAVLAEHGRLFMIANLHQSKSFSPEGRKFLAEWGTKHTITAIAQYGISIVTQTISVLVAAAIRLLGGRAVEIKNVKDEAEARAWIAEQKQRKLGLPSLN